MRQIDINNPETQKALKVMKQEELMEMFCIWGFVIFLIAWFVI